MLMLLLRCTISTWSASSSCSTADAEVLFEDTSEEEDDDIREDDDEDDMDMLVALVLVVAPKNDDDDDAGDTVDDEVEATGDVGRELTSGSSILPVELDDG